MAKRRGLLSRALGWIWGEYTGANDRELYERVYRRAAATRPRAPAARKATPKTRAYRPVRARPVRATGGGDAEFERLARMAERGELKGAALGEFINRYQVVRKRRK